MTQGQSQAAHMAYMVSVRKLKKKSGQREFCDEVGPGQFLQCKDARCSVDDILPRKEWLQALLSDLKERAGDAQQQVLFYVHPFRSTAAEALAQ